MEPREISLASLADGAAEQLFQAAFADVLKNIDDPNTAWKAPREITLRIRVSCDEQRRAGAISIGCATKLPGARPVSTIIHLGRHQGQFTAVEAFKQEDLFPTPIGGPVAVETTSEGGA